MNAQIDAGGISTSEWSEVGKCYRKRVRVLCDCVMCVCVRATAGFDPPAAVIGIGMVSTTANAATAHTRSMVDDIMTINCGNFRGAQAWLLDF